MHPDTHENFVLKFEAHFAPRIIAYAKNTNHVSYDKYEEETNGY